MNEPAKETRIWTVLELIRASADFLERKGIVSARLDAELLLAHLLGLDRLKLYIDAQRPVVPAERAAYRQLVQSRGERIPLQRLTGQAQILDLTFAVHDGVFVPRPETETLIGVCTDLLGDHGPADFVEVGTGTGCVGISLLHRWRQATAVAFELSPEAVATTRENATRHGVIDRLDLRHEDGLAAELPRCRLLVSNPPYIPTADLAGLDPEVRDHDPTSALDGGADGLDAIRRLADSGTRCLSPGGWIVFEHGADQAESCRALLDDLRYEDVASHRDLADRWRVTGGRRPA